MKNDNDEDKNMVMIILVKMVWMTMMINKIDDMNRYNDNDDCMLIITTIILMIKNWITKVVRMTIIMKTTLIILN